MDGDDSYTTSRVCLMWLKRTPKKMIKMENYAMYVSPQKETDAKRAPRRVTRGRNGVSGRGREEEGVHWCSHFEKRFGVTPAPRRRTEPSPGTSARTPVARGLRQSPQKLPRGVRRSTAPAARAGERAGR